jgi:hypothetical protein
VIATTAVDYAQQFAMCGVTYFFFVKQIINEHFPQTQHLQNYSFIFDTSFFDRINSRRKSV